MIENKKSILLLFKERKKETPNSFFYERKFSREYNTSILYISDYLYKNNHAIAKIINTIIEEKKISIVLFEGDHISIFDSNFIKLISNKVKKGLFLQDDYMYHYINRITASACDFVFTGCYFHPAETCLNRIFLNTVLVNQFTGILAHSRISKRESKD